MRILVALSTLAANFLLNGLSGSGTLLVSLSGESDVALVDIASQKTIAKLTVGRGPHEITIAPDGRAAYVAISGSGPGGVPGKSIARIDLSNRSVQIFDQGICRQPHDVRVSRDAKLVWIACGPDQSVQEVDARTGKLLKTWKTNVDGGWFVEVSRDNHKLFVPHLEGKSLTIIDRASGDTRNIAFPVGMAGIAISPDGREVWTGYGDAGGARIAILDARSEKLLATIDAGVAGFPRMAFTPDGSRIVIVLDKQCAILDAKTRAILARVELPAGAKVVTVDGSGQHTFLTSPDSNQVLVVDVNAGKLLASFPTGKQPDGIAWVK